jgi:hypothetical protein
LATKTGAPYLAQPDVGNRAKRDPSQIPSLPLPPVDPMKCHSERSEEPRISLEPPERQKFTPKSKARRLGSKPCQAPTFPIRAINPKKPNHFRQKNNL